MRRYGGSLHIALDPEFCRVNNLQNGSVAWVVADRRFLLVATSKEAAKEVSEAAHSAATKKVIELVLKDRRDK